MIRRVAFGKAVAAGAAGALVWELCVRALLAAGVPLFDLVRLLGTLLLGEAQPAAWWPAGLLIHAGVGGIWAIFYAYFFWSAWDRPPALQGLVFSLGPGLLAGLVMVPQLALMHDGILHGRAPAPGLFALRLGWGGPLGILLGHLAYGVSMGALYTRPVGHAVKKEARLA